MEFACLCVPCKDLPAPRSLAEALQQRMDIYKSAAEGAKSKGDDRKARMHQRIVKVHTIHLKPAYLLSKQNNYLIKKTNV